VLPGASGSDGFREVYRNDYAFRAGSILWADAVYPWGCMGVAAGVFFLLLLFGPAVVLLREGTLAGAPWQGFQGVLLWLGGVALTGIVAASHLHPLWRLLRVYVYVRGGGPLAQVEGPPELHSYSESAPDLYVAGEKFGLEECSGKAAELEALSGERGTLRVRYIPARSATLTSAGWYRPFDLYTRDNILIAAEWRPDGPPGGAGPHGPPASGG
jgi:hypothetical protein